MQKIHIVSHTHWDREWYQPFQGFRLRLVHLVDNLLTLLDDDPTYLHYMLDGQTIVLEDYLQMRMANLPRLQHYIQENRILIGPWYILPDEFLVSPESTIRNLLIGKRICEYFGQRMMVGYIPDPFGHISQLPQILQGFHIDTACLWRGVPENAPTLLWWQAPDGTQVLLAHLYTSYGNGAHWPAFTIEQSGIDLQNAVDVLEAHNPINHFLIMRGSDHLEPRPTLPTHIAALNQVWEGEKEVHHSTLPAYLTGATQEIADHQLALHTIQGELRDPRKANMLPGVLSVRMWIKQRNHQAETLLERWVEPFSTWAELVSRGAEAFTDQTVFQKEPRINDPAPLIHQAWKLLISNHPHDSICGCSIDQTHDEMRPRFDQIDQIGTELTKQSLQALASNVNSMPPADQSDAFAAITVFNASPYAQSSLVSFSLDLPDPDASIQVLDEASQPVAFSSTKPERVLFEQNSFPVSELLGFLRTVGEFGYADRRLINVSVHMIKGQMLIETEFSNILPPNHDGLASAMIDIRSILETTPPDTRIKVNLYNTWATQVTLLAENVPPIGFCTLWVVPEKQMVPLAETTNAATGDQKTIENEFFHIYADSTDGTLTLTDKRNAVIYTGLNAFRDVGDRGDEYNFCPPEQDHAISPKLKSLDVYVTPLSSTLTLHFTFDLPNALTESREMRSLETVQCNLVSTVTLTKRSPHIDFHTEFDNQARDHRLEVRFPTGLHVETARMDGHFDVVTRSLDLPEADATWMELPRPEVPQRAFTDVSIQGQGLMLANRGLPEVAVLRRDDGSAEISLTLLRCVGWLSRDDMWVRKRHAGPGLPTPGAQELGTHSFEYSLLPHAGNWLEAAQQAYTYQTPLQAATTPLHAGALSPSSTMVQADQPAYLLTAVKATEVEDGWIVRGVNLSDAPIQVRLKPFKRFPIASLVYLDESFKQALDMAPDGSVQFEIPAHGIATIKFHL